MPEFFLGLVFGFFLHGPDGQLTVHRESFQLDVVPFLVAVFPGRADLGPVTFFVIVPEIADAVCPMGRRFVFGFGFRIFIRHGVSPLSFV